MDDSVKIVNQNIYLSRMSDAILDKCWWTRLISDDIDTIVDFGCANCEIVKVIGQLLPNKKIKYYGIDNSCDMLLAAKNNIFEGTNINVYLHKKIEDVISVINPTETILILNSVLHEIFSYLDIKEQNKLLTLFFASSFKYIAIRDMHLSNIIKPIQTVEAHISKIKLSEFAKEWDDFEKICFKRNGIFHNRGIQLEEFLLKYRYRENWKRESKEQYLWNWSNIVLKQAVFKNKYNIKYSERFFIPYIANNIEKDFGFSWQYDTHKKILLKSTNNI